MFARINDGNTVVRHGTQSPPGIATESSPELLQARGRNDGQSQLKRLPQIRGRSAVKINHPPSPLLILSHTLICSPLDYCFLLAAGTFAEIKKYGIRIDGAFVYPGLSYCKRKKVTSSPKCSVI